MYIERGTTTSAAADAPSGSVPRYPEVHPPAINPVRRQPNIPLISRTCLTATARRIIYGTETAGAAGCPHPAASEPQVLLRCGDTPQHESQSCRRIWAILSGLHNLNKFKNPIKMTNYDHQLFRNWSNRYSTDIIPGSRRSSVPPDPFRRLLERVCQLSNATGTRSPDAESGINPEPD